jgi:16S rRNA (adenine1518-N6/adenine1519-N6)-dimethyltransferase
VAPVLPASKKSLGQCFLVEREYARQIADALGLRNGDTVLEIGPGRGMLTAELVESPAQVLAIEIDGRLIDPLTDRFGSAPNFGLIHKDFLETSLEETVAATEFKVAGNLPYHLVSEVLFKLFAYVRRARSDSTRPWPSRAVLMMQKEVAQRIAARQGSKTYGLTSVFTQLEARAELLFMVPANAFRPMPKVDGAVVKLEFYRIPPAYPQDFQVCERMLRYCFHQRRKMLKHTLAQLAGIHPHWLKAEIEFTRRPETLSPAEWVTLSDTVSQARGTSGSNDPTQ